MSRAALLVVLAAGCGKPPPATSTPTIALPPPAPPAPTAPRVGPPVPHPTQLACNRLLTTARLATALGETAPVTLVDRSSDHPDATAVCEILRGGKPLTDAEQRQIAKTEGRLGVLPGDAICSFRASCWTLEDPARFERTCADNQQPDRSMGTFACVEVLPMGANDVHTYRFLDEDSGCVFFVQGGIANVDNDSIRTCAKAIRDLIGPAQVAIPPP